MSINIRTGHTFRHEPTSKPPPRWAMELFAVAVFLPAVMVFSAGAVVVLVGRAISNTCTE